MPRRSKRENKNVYQTTREELGLSREDASKALGNMLSADMIEKIETGKRAALPLEVMAMAKAYGKPFLCNYHCARECDIGKKYVPELKLKALSQIVLETLDSLNNMEHKQERLIKITADGHINDDEIDDFILIQEELDRISMIADTLRLWLENMLASGVINSEEYERRRKNIEN